MKKSSQLAAAICCLALWSSVPVHGAGAPDGSTLDVLKMEQIPPGTYEVQLKLGDSDETVSLSIKGTRAAFVRSSTPKLEGLSGQYEFIGNGVFMARLAGPNHRATQWWIFHPDGTASVKEIPDRGEKQTAKPISDK
jgi:hypothetical protein